MDGRRFTHIERRGDRAECQEAIYDIEEEIAYRQKNPSHGADIPRLLRQITALKMAVEREFFNKIARVAELIIKACDSTVTVRSDCAAMKITERERTIAEALVGLKCKVLRNGWPDFLAVLNSKLIGIEVKSPKDRLSRQQLEMKVTLENAGIPVLIVTGSRSLEKQIRDLKL